MTQIFIHQKKKHLYHSRIRSMYSILLPILSKKLCVLVGHCNTSLFSELGSKWKWVFFSWWVHLFCFWDDICVTLFSSDSLFGTVLSLLHRPGTFFELLCSLVSPFLFDFSSCYFQWLIRSLLKVLFGQEHITNPFFNFLGTVIR